MPMSREARMEKVQRLLTAHKKTTEVLEGEPVTRELHPGTDIARNWTVITSAYSGLEQTLKYLIAEECELSIEELIDFIAPQNAEVNELRHGRYPYRTHNLVLLFLKLQEPTQVVVRDFCQRFRSLHSYIGNTDVDQFLTLISGPKGAGYER